MAEARLKTLLDWGKENGAIVNDKLEFQVTKDRGVIGVAKEDITNGKDLFKIPKCMFLTPKLAEDFFKDTWKTSHDRNEQLQFLLAKLKFDDHDVIVDGKNLTKFMKPYIDFLPTNGRDLGLPYFWTEEEKDLLRGTDAEIFLQRFQDAIVEEWYHAVCGIDGISVSDDMKQFYKDYKKGNYHKGMAYFLEQKITCWFSFPAYLWSHCVLASRAFPYIVVDPNTKKLHKAFLIPVLDLLNHKNDTEVSWHLHDEYITASTAEKPCNMKKGMELYNNYGSKPDYQLLLGYGFVPANNEHDLATLSLKVDQKVVDGALKFGVKLPEGASAKGINFELTMKNPLPKNLIDFFAYIVRLRSEHGMLTSRMLLDGLANLRSILDTKVDVFRKFKVQSDRRISSSVVKVVKAYRAHQKSIFVQAFEKTIQLEKIYLKKYQAISFKKIIKKDKVFFNSLVLTFGIMNYQDLVDKKLTDQVVLLWIIRNANKDLYKDLPDIFPDFISNEFEEVKKSVPVTAQDVMEFKQTYNSLFPVLSEKIPEVYGVGDWSPRSFIVAGTVADRLTYKKPANSEVFFLRKSDNRMEPDVD